MNSIDFNHSVLFISLRSPFARRVRLALLEHQILFEEQVYDVLKPTQDLIAVNPLVRVPALRLNSGHELIDSHLILQCFYQSVDSPLRPQLVSEQLEAFRWSALGTGLCDRIVEYYLETLRPSQNQDHEVLEEMNQIVERTLAIVERYLKTRNSHWLVGSSLTQADLDMGTALAYLKLRYSSDCLNLFPKVTDYLARLDERPSFQKTRPPV